MTDNVSILDLARNATLVRLGMTVIEVAA